MTGITCGIREGLEERVASVTLGVVTAVPGHVSPSSRSWIQFFPGKASRCYVLMWNGTSKAACGRCGTPLEGGVSQTPLVTPLAKMGCTGENTQPPHSLHLTEVRNGKRTA